MKIMMSATLMSCRHLSNEFDKNARVYREDTEPADDVELLEAEATFWDTHDITDMFDDLEVVPVKFERRLL